MAVYSLKVLAGATVLGAMLATPASAQIDPFDEVLATIGITTGSRPHIDYRERAPLVVPPSGSNLRAPEQKASSRNPRWPVDPDLEARRKAAAANNARDSFGGGDNTASARIIRDGNKERNRYAGVPTVGTYNNGGDANPARALTRDQVSRIHADAADSDKPTTGSGVDPGRSTLTDPPTGYRNAQGGRPIRATVDPQIVNTDRVEIDVNNPNR